MEPNAHRYLCPILLPILWLLLQQTKCNFPCVYPTWTRIWPLNFPGPFWPFLSCSGCLRQALPLPPMFSPFCTFSTFPLAIFPVQSSVFSSSWGFTDAHVHFTHFEASKPSEEKQQFGSPMSHHAGLELTQEGVYACVKGRESTNQLRLHPRQNSYSLPEASGFAYLRNSHL